MASETLDLIHWLLPAPLIGQYPLSSTYTMQMRATNHKSCCLQKNAKARPLKCLVTALPECLIWEILVSQYLQNESLRHCTLNNPPARVDPMYRVWTIDTMYRVWTIDTMYRVWTIDAMHRVWTIDTMYRVWTIDTMHRAWTIDTMF